MKIVLVTGGSGLVGSAIKSVSKYFDDYLYIFITSKDYDLTKLENTILMFEKHKPNYVIHLAACVGGLYKNMNNKDINTVLDLIKLKNKKFNKCIFVLKDLNVLDNFFKKYNVLL